MVIFDEHDDILIISPVGEMTISQIPLFREKIDAYKMDKFHKIIVNLEKLTFIDSSGLGTLVLLIKDIKSNFGAVVISSPQDQVAKLLKMVKIYKYIDVMETLKSAIEHMENE